MLAALPLVFVLNAAPAGDTGASPADAVVAAAFAGDTKKIDTKTENVQSTDASFPMSNLIAPGLGLAGLIALTFTLKRRKKTLGGTGIALLEATSLGDKRSLVIADVLGERMVLGVSEAGITVLMSKPAPSLNEEAPLRLPPPANTGAPQPQPMGFFQRLIGKSPAPAFDAALQESVEDQELRAKLQAGVRSVVP
ncbi:MAG: flagellar biosynthetic protein FliO [Archangium sp.]